MTEDVYQVDNQRGIDELVIQPVTMGWFFVGIKKVCSSNDAWAIFLCRKTEVAI